jgi:hypothetical protein
MDEYRTNGAQIVNVVNSQAELLAAAKEAIALIDGRIWPEEKIKLQAAIAEQA